MTHKNMMTMSGTHMQGLHTTLVCHHAQLDQLCCVCCVKHMMITRQVRHHTHLDLLTCRVCSMKHMMIMRQYFPRLWYDPYPLHARGLGLYLFSVRWIVICCQDGFFMALPKVSLDSVRRALGRVPRRARRRHGLRSVGF